MVGGQAQCCREYARLVATTRMVGIQAVVAQFRNIDQGPVAIRQLHRVVPSSTIRISFARPYCDSMPRRRKTASLLDRPGNWDTATVRPADHRSQCLPDLRITFGKFFIYEPPGISFGLGSVSEGLGLLLA